MWYLNFCSPFRYEVTSSQSTSRYVMYASLLAAFIVYIFYVAKYKFFGQLIPIKSEYVKQNVLNNKFVVSYKGVGQRDFRLNQKKFKQWYTHYFGLHSVAVGAAIMYAPYIPQLVFVVIHFILFTICTIMHSCVKKKAVLYIYNFFMVICILLNIILLFTASMGVGASGYDSQELICYLQRTD